MFRPCKQTGPPRKETFLIPKLPAGSVGVDYHSIVNRYLEEINKEVAPGPDQTPWYQGRYNETTKSSSFAKQALGINEMRKIPKYMAEVIFDNTFYYLKFNG